MTQKPKTTIVCETDDERRGLTMFIAGSECSHAQQAIWRNHPVGNPSWRSLGAILASLFLTGLGGMGLGLEFISGVETRFPIVVYVGLALAGFALLWKSRDFDEPQWEKQREARKNAMDAAMIEHFETALIKTYRTKETGND